MTIFQTIVLIMFVVSLCAQWGMALYQNSIRLCMLFGFEIVAFGYLAKTLM